MSDLSPKAAILTAAFSPGPATPAPAPPTTPTTPTAPPSSSPVGPQGEINATQATTMADWTRKDVASGKISAEQAEKIFDDLGVPADQRAAPVNSRDEEPRLIDSQFPVPPPEAYQIGYASPGQPWPEMTPELKQFDTTARSWLVAAEFST